MGFGVQAAGSSTASTLGPRARERFPGRPPPVMWAMPLTTFFLR